MSIWQWRLRWDRTYRNQTRFKRGISQFRRFCQLSSWLPVQVSFGPKTFGPLYWTILNAWFSTTVTDRTWMPHLPNFINRDIMYQMESDFAPEMKRTSGHQRRSYNDLQYQMMYTYYVIESPHNYPYQLIDHREHVGYCALTDDYFKNRYRLRKTRNERKKFICLNDDMKHHSSFVAKQTYDLVNKFYSEFYPNASTFELWRHKNNVMLSTW